jgi:hypothetical protein
MLIFLMEYWVRILNEKVEADSRLRSFQLVMDMQQGSCMLRQFQVKELCEEYVKRTEI